jgi:hypothetical protein
MIKSFLKQLTLHAPNRQVQQPEDALRHYMLFPEKISISTLLPDQDTGPLWESVKLKMKEILRVRQLSYQKEKSYLFCG